MKTIRKSMHTYLPTLLNKNSIVLDCGSNRGEFSRWISIFVGCQVHGFEPDPRFYPMLPELPGVIFHNLAIMPAAGLLKFSIAEGADGTAFYSNKNKFSEDIIVKAVGLGEFCSEKNIKQIDLLKVDIEGAEIPLFLECPDDVILLAKQITIEFHDFINPLDKPKILKIIDRLDQLGFWVISVSYWDYSDVLCVNTNMVKLSRWDKMFIAINAKYIRGIMRLLCRVVGCSSDKN